MNMFVWRRFLQCSKVARVGIATRSVIFAELHSLGCSVSLVPPASSNSSRVILGP